jgi:hypothetical protein
MAPKDIVETRSGIAKKITCKRYSRVSPCTYIPWNTVQCQISLLKVTTAPPPPAGDILCVLLYNSCQVDLFERDCLTRYCISTE